VVIAMDWSPASDKALKYFLVFQELVKELEIINVINGKLTIKDMRLLNDKLTKTRKLCLKKGIDAEYHVYAGKTAEEIALAAEDYKASLIVLGRNPRSTLMKKLFDPSISCQIAEGTHVPVLVVP
jgi:nucleotide-binding universal stress UspA family protein